MLKKWEIALILSFFIVLAYGSFSHSFAQGIAENLIRFHIIANSNSTEDQALKYKVRDKILSEFAFESENLIMAKENILESLDEIEAVANMEIQNNGYDYVAKVSLTREYFPTREYEGFSLVAGEYTSLLVEIEKAEGENWWCVVYPSICLDYNNDIDETFTMLDDSEKDFINSDSISLKFKSAEIYSTIKHFFKD